MAFRKPEVELGPFFAAFRVNSDLGCVADRIIGNM